jgi:CheY-like chemotaxis protein
MPDIVILDFNMPGMGGLSTARLISHRLLGIKILLHTANRNEMLEANASMALFGLWTRQMEETCSRLSAGIQIQKEFDESVADERRWTAAAILRGSGAATEELL